VILTLNQVCPVSTTAMGSSAFCSGGMIAAVVLFSLAVLSLSDVFACCLSLHYKMINVMQAKKNLRI
jgi:hypothetical protein